MPTAKLSRQEFQHHAARRASGETVSDEQFNRAHETLLATNTDYKETFNQLTASTARVDQFIDRTNTIINDKSYTFKDNGNYIFPQLNTRGLIVQLFNLTSAIPAMWRQAGAEVKLSRIYQATPQSP